ncbi:MAG: T9SS type A sorting domain-containing protein [candidate division Zixibacteria bacterium]|nr:T9SS type A sorting domain-containing protein [candidate division Zixibacteria bacterium]
MYIEGANVGYDHRTTQFFGYLGCEFRNIGQENVIESIEGIDGTYSAPNSFLYQGGSDADYNIDELGPGEGTLFLEDQDGTGRAVFYNEGRYRVITSAPVLGAYHDGEGSSTKASMMMRYIGFLTGVEDPNIFTSYDEMDFGIQYVDYEDTLVLNIQNLGFSNLSLNSVELIGNGFSMDDFDPIVLSTGEEIFVSVYFFSSEAGDFTGSITVESSDPDNPTIEIDLQAECLLPPVMSTSHDEMIVTVPPGETRDLTFTISNSGNSDLAYSIELVDLDLVYNPEPSQQIISKRIKLPKGAIDEREGPPVITGFGGPDTYGHKWIDSNEPGGPEYTWYDISDIGQNSGLSGDDESVVLDLPFTFEFYGEEKTYVTVSTNGYLTFGMEGGIYFNDTLPSSNPPNDVIAPFWYDLHQQNGTNYFLYDSNMQRFIIQYSNWGFFSDDGTLNFQVQLYENGQIYFYYDYMTGTLNSATVGIENMYGNDGLQIVYNSNYVESYLAVRISSGPTWLEVDTDNGIIAPASSDNITFTFDARGLEEGEYHANSIIRSNDPALSEITIPTTLICGITGVDEEVLPMTTRLYGNYPNPFNSETSIEFGLAEKCHVDIQIFNLLGQQVAKPVDEIFEAGHHIFNWNASKVVSGVYFYKFTTENYSQTKKMLFLK